MIGDSFYLVVGLLNLRVLGTFGLGESLTSRVKSNPIEKETQMNLNLVLLSLTALLLFQGPPLWSQEKTSDKETSVKSQKQTFDKIVAFYKKAFPEGNFKYPPLRFSDGTDKNPRVTIQVPKNIESLYMTKFSLDVLQFELKSDNNLRKIIAKDLIQLRKPILLKRPKGKISYDGKNDVASIGYVVSRDIKK